MTGLVMTDDAPSSPSSTVDVSSTTGPAKVAKPLNSNVIAKLHKIAKEDVDEMLINSTVLRIGKNKLDVLPKYDVKKTDFGKMLGKGHFCTVKEVRSVRMDSLCEDDDNNEGEANSSKEDCSSRLNTGLPPLQEGRALGTGSFVSPANCTKLVAKQINKSLMSDKNEYFVGVRSLAIEAYFLAAIDHKHILKIKGVSDDLLYNTSSFIVLERLHGTLHNKLVEWSARMRKFGGITSVVRKNMGEKKRLFSKERYEVALQVTSAIQYLHENNVLFRDLKTENIGLDENDEVKIFDFGLSREVDPTKGKPYKLTGMIGSWFYMAPEVYYGKPYDESIDIFSLGIVLWQLVALDRLYPGVSSTKMLEADVMAKGMRPKLQPDWPESLKRLLNNMWSEDPEDRPKANKVSILIKREIASVVEQMDESNSNNNAESNGRPALGGFLRRRFTT